MLVKEYQISNLPDFVKYICKIRKEHFKLWFRGVNDIKHNLNPSILRRKDIKDRNAYSKLEKEIMARFKERSIPYLNSTPNNNWDWLFFMQHYGIPTRLLDWTENPFIGLFFALLSVEKTVKGVYKKDVAVWIVDPIVWNNNVLSFQGYEEGILSTSDEQLSPFSPPADYKSIPNYPLALNGAYNSARIVAQRGTFFIFGAPGKTMNEYFEKDMDSGFLEKIVIKKEHIEVIKTELIQSGITDSVVFPDLEGLSKEIKYDFGFGV